MKLAMLIASALLGGATLVFSPMEAAMPTTTTSQTTRDHLKAAMQGEAFASAKYLLYAERARMNGNTAVADLFDRIGRQERAEHFAEEAALFQLAGDDAANLMDAITGESYEVDTMYREFAEQAHAAGDDAAGFRFEEIRRDEMKHRDAFKAALEQLYAGQAHH